VRARLLAGLLLLLPAAGCSHTVGLDVAYPAAGVNRALLASAAPRRVAVGPITDRRRETRLGIEPESGKDIVTRRPVSEIVREALALEVGANGHTAAPDQPDLTLAADVEDFRLDVLRGYKNAQLVGKVVLAVMVTDARTGGVLLARRYAGVHRREAADESDRDPRATMDTALARAMHDLATDPDLARAFAGIAPAAAR
jgi:uncharacterized lipoprotein YajG